MNISLHLSGLILIVAGLLFLVSACFAKAIYLWVCAALCILVGILWLLPRRYTSSFRRFTRRGKYSK